MEVSRIICVQAALHLGKLIPFPAGHEAGRTAEFLWIFWGISEYLAFAASRSSDRSSLNPLAEYDRKLWLSCVQIAFRIIREHKI